MLTFPVLTISGKQLDSYVESFFSRDKSQSNPTKTLLASQIGDCPRGCYQFCTGYEHLDDRTEWLWFCFKPRVVTHFRWLKLSPQLDRVGVST